MLYVKPLTTPIPLPTLHGHLFNSLLYQMANRTASHPEAPCAVTCVAQLWLFIITWQTLRRAADNLSQVNTAGRKVYELN